MSALALQVGHIPSSQVDVIRCPVLNKMPLCHPPGSQLLLQKNTGLVQVSCHVCQPCLDISDTPECLSGIRHCFIEKLVSKQRALLCVTKQPLLSYCPFGEEIQRDKLVAAHSTFRKLHLVRGWDSFRLALKKQTLI